MNKDLFGVQYNKRLTKVSFDWNVSTIQNTQLVQILLTDPRFKNKVIDESKTVEVKSKIKYKKKQIPKSRKFCPFTGRARFRSRFFGSMSRFAFRDMVKEGSFLTGVFRSGW